ncbi:MAG: dienelactone hydrolase family protein [Acidimicrobiia bacterium]
MLKWLGIGFGALVVVLAGVLWSGVIEDNLFTVWDPNPLQPNPARQGPFEIVTDRIEVPDGADGEPFGIIVYRPDDADGPLPTFVWVMGSNVQAYYHEALHETLASWGYVVVAPDTRPLRFIDLRHHGKVVALAEQATGLALAGELGVDVDADRLALGGYSVGGPLAALTAADVPEADAIVHWAPAPPPYWQGVDADDRFPRVVQPSLFLLGGVDEFSPPTGGPAEALQAAMPDAPATTIVIEGANHHQFQQPQGGADVWPRAEIGLEDQQRQAIEATLEWLDETLDVER